MSATRGPVSKQKKFIINNEETFIDSFLRLNKVYSAKFLMALNKVDWIVFFLLGYSKHLVLRKITPGFFLLFHYQFYKSLKCYTIYIFDISQLKICLKV